MPMIGCYQMLVACLQAMICVACSGRYVCHIAAGRCVMGLSCRISGGNLAPCVKSDCSMGDDGH